MPSELFQALQIWGRKPSPCPMELISSLWMGMINKEANALNKTHRHRQQRKKKKKIKAKDNEQGHYFMSELAKSYSDPTPQKDVHFVTNFSKNMFRTNILSREILAIVVTNLVERILLILEDIITSLLWYFKVCRSYSPGSFVRAVTMSSYTSIPFLSRLTKNNWMNEWKNEAIWILLVSVIPW